MPYHVSFHCFLITMYRLSFLIVVIRPLSVEIKAENTRNIYHAPFILISTFQKPSMSTSGEADLDQSLIISRTMASGHTSFWPRAAKMNSPGNTKDLNAVSSPSRFWKRSSTVLSTSWASPMPRLSRRHSSNSTNIYTRKTIM